MEDKKISTLILLDLSAAFDTIDHDIMLYRLEHYFGLKDKCLGLLATYLRGRKQAVRIGDSDSNNIDIKTGFRKDLCSVQYFFHFI